MKNKIIKYIKEFLLFIVVMIIFANIISFYKASDLNKLALDINYPYDKNKPILVHIWASWCPTCKMEASNIQSISRDYQVLTFIVKSGSDADIKKYMIENDFDFNTINDEDGFFAEKFNVSAYPTTLIYNKNQELVFSEVGYTSTLGLRLRMWYASL
ncbi:redoxin domain-containing protein [Sulfurimonas lithotrophica]|uniref:Redoxin domain-containing protein n=1 Tax=Sulfurimonas lithotrophica TaxID=2590022 RepID=A0A5P8P2J0_9BACT|nr:thioredoxin domain-containing protein [Sulfurimonas lithotrophica]QFR49841.1 redoxin domain-containing protein [Sulfurimonas lithotrophica]